MNNGTEMSEDGAERAAHSPLHYALVIEWSDEDQVYVVSFPEWEATGLYFVHTHGETYEEAAQSGREVLADLVALAQAEGKPLPAPRTFATASGI